MNAEIYTKTDCNYCVRAKELFKNKNIKYKELVLGSDYTREDLLKKVPQARSVPQIWLDGNYIGGYTELAAFFNS